MKIIKTKAIFLRIVLIILITSACNINCHKQMVRQKNKTKFSTFFDKCFDRFDDSYKMLSDCNKAIKHVIKHVIKSKNTSIFKRLTKLLIFSNSITRTRSQIFEINAIKLPFQSIHHEIPEDIFSSITCRNDQLLYKFNQDYVLYTQLASSSNNNKLFLGRYNVNYDVWTDLLTLNEGHYIYSRDIRSYKGNGNNEFIFTSKKENKFDNTTNIVIGLGNSDNGKILNLKIFNNTNPFNDVHSLKITNDNAILLLSNFDQLTNFTEPFLGVVNGTINLKSLYKIKNQNNNQITLYDIYLNKNAEYILSGKQSQSNITIDSEALLIFLNNLKSYNSSLILNFNFTVKPDLLKFQNAEFSKTIETHNNIYALGTLFNNITKVSQRDTLPFIAAFFPNHTLRWICGFYNTKVYNSDIFDSKSQSKLGVLLNTYKGTFYGTVNYNGQFNDFYRIDSPGQNPLTFYSNVNCNNNFCIVGKINGLVAFGEIPTSNFPPSSDQCVSKVSLNIIDLLNFTTINLNEKFLILEQNFSKLVKQNFTLVNKTPDLETICKDYDLGWLVYVIVIAIALLACCCCCCILKCCYFNLEGRASVNATEKNVGMALFAPEEEE